MRLVILAFDQSATQTGYAIFEAPGEPVVICGSFSCKDGRDGNEQADIFAAEVKHLANIYKPDFFAWERAKPNISAYPKKGKPDLGGDPPAGQWTVNAGQLILPEIQGILRGMAKAYGKPSASAYPSTWRAAVLGRGAGHYTRDEAKAAAKRHCEFLKIKAHNENEAEAACVALWAASTSEFRWALDRARKRAEVAA